MLMALFFFTAGAIVILLVFALWIKHAPNASYGKCAKTIIKFESKPWQMCPCGHVQIRSIITIPKKTTNQIEYNDFLWICNQISLFYFLSTRQTKQQNNSKKVFEFSTICQRTFISRSLHMNGGHGLHLRNMCVCVAFTKLLFYLFCFYWRSRIK